jgi:hypothetical protein
MPEPTCENQIKLALLQNNLISMEIYKISYIAQHEINNYTENSITFALIDAPNKILNADNYGDVGKIFLSGTIYVKNYWMNYLAESSGSIVYDVIICEVEYVLYINRW